MEDVFGAIGGASVGVSLLAWIYLLCFHHRFWWADQNLPSGQTALHQWPKVVACIPARNEVETIGAVIASHLQTSYPGELVIVLIDDQSSDGTTGAARGAFSSNPQRLLHIDRAPNLAAGWTGKLWALNAAVTKASTLAPDAKYYLFTDADIVYEASALTDLVRHAERHAFAMTSVMARLDDRGGWASLLIPAFVYFFQKLYPFPAVNDGRCVTAGAAGGCALVRAELFHSSGGLSKIRGELIDDCALARLMKGQPPRHRIWLGFSDKVRSLRDNRSLSSIWNMVARTAFTQLNYSSLLLVGTVFGLLLLYASPPLAVGTYPFHTNDAALFLGAGAWMLMSISFWPTLKKYGKSVLLAPCLPIAGFAYALMTFHSAIRHWLGSGGRWKGRTYTSTGN